MGKSVETRLREKGIDEKEFIENTALLGLDWARDKVGIRTDIPLARFFYEKTGNQDHGRVHSFYRSNPDNGNTLFKAFIDQLIERIEYYCSRYGPELEKLKQDNAVKDRQIELIMSKLAYYEKREVEEIEQEMLIFIKAKEI